MILLHVSKQDKDKILACLFDRMVLVHGYKQGKNKDKILARLLVSRHFVLIIIYE
jgi:hypothetical protein